MKSIPALAFAALAPLVSCSSPDGSAAPDTSPDASSFLPDASAFAPDASALAPDAPDAPDAPAVPYDWQLPQGFVVPLVPEENPMSEAKVTLGRRLFYDKRLSYNQTQACASCHQQALAFTDGKAKAVGSTGETHKRGALTLSNAAWRATYEWQNSLVRTLEGHVLVPLFNMDPAYELAMDGHEDVLIARLQADAVYPELFRQAFPDRTDQISVRSTVFSIASFVRTIVSANSPYDRYRLGDEAALGPAEKRGMALFFGKARCAECHSGLTFTDAEWHEGLLPSQIPFHNDGLYNVDGNGGLPFSDPGLAVQTARPEDVGMFRTPTLRNVALTAPYMHDGSLATLEEVIAHYANPFSLDDNGNRVLASPRRDERVQGIYLSLRERADLKAFLLGLTDEGFLTDPRFSDPFAAP
jgi:cytochrome c peroxidase